MYQTTSYVFDDADHARLVRLKIRKSIRMMKPDTDVSRKASPRSKGARGARPRVGQLPRRWHSHHRARRRRIIDHSLKRKYNLFHYTLPKLGITSASLTLRISKVCVPLSMTRRKQSIRRPSATRSSTSWTSSVSPESRMKRSCR